jgi:hypothetical protein
MIHDRDAIFSNQINEGIRNFVYSGESNLGGLHYDYQLQEKAA